MGALPPQLLHYVVLFVRSPKYLAKLALACKVRRPHKPRCKSGCRGRG